MSLNDLSTPVGQAWGQLASWIKRHPDIGNLNVRVNTHKACREHSITSEELLTAIRDSPEHAKSAIGRSLVKAFDQSPV